MGLAVIVGATLVYLLLLAAVPYEALVPFLSAGRFIAAGTVVVIFSTRAAQSLLRGPGNTTSTDQLINGIALSWVATAFIAEWGDVGRIVGFSTALATSPVSGFGILMMTVAAAFHVTSPGIRTGFRMALGFCLTAAIYVAIQVVGSYF